jgi:hypothetical protein
MCTWLVSILVRSEFPRTRIEWGFGYVDLNILLICPYLSADKPGHGSQEGMVWMESKKHITL